MLLRETIAVYCGHHIEHASTLCGQDTENLYIRVGGYIWWPICYERLKDCFKFCKCIRITIYCSYLSSGILKASVYQLAFNSKVNTITKVCVSTCTHELRGVGEVNGTARGR